MEKYLPFIWPTLFLSSGWIFPIQLILSTNMTFFPLWLRYCGSFFPVPLPPSLPGCRIFPSQHSPLIYCVFLLSLLSLLPSLSQQPWEPVARPFPPSLLRFCPWLYPGLDKSFCPIKLCVGGGGGGRDGTTGIRNVVHPGFGYCAEKCLLFVYISFLG